MEDLELPGSGSDTQPGSRPRTPWDHVAEQLQARRQRAGDPSYAEIARRISERRVAEGQSEHAARLARTTVYDVFRTGRARMNLALVREIAAVLDTDEAEVDVWVAEARAAAEPTATPPEEPAPRLRTIALLLGGCVAVNLLGRLFVEFLHLPIYLDMVGTAVAAFALGPWYGVGVGVSTNLLGVTSSGTASIPFALVNVAGALAWGYGARRFAMARTLPRFLSLNLVVALVCTVVAVPILLAYGGSTGHGEDTISATFLDLTSIQAVAIGASNLLVSVADKVISGFLALVVVSLLPAALRRGFYGPT